MENSDSDVVTMLKLICLEGCNAMGEGDGMREGRGENEVPFLGLELL